MSDEIEVIDQHGARHRFPAYGHYYEWRLKHGTIDVEGNEFLDIFRRCADDADAFEVIATFPRVARVGMVTDACCLSMPLRELQMEQCPQCGFIPTSPAEELHRWKRAAEANIEENVWLRAELERIENEQKPAD